MIKRREVIALLALGSAIATGPAAMAAERGHYRGKLTTTWLDDGDGMLLQRSFIYIDGNGVAWKVPAGAEVDGASIPRVFWPIVGHPFQHPYRKAAVIHDWYCDVRERPWREVHRMFYEAMLAAGVDKHQANVMYLAVYAGGPRWNNQTIRNNKIRAQKELEWITLRDQWFAAKERMARDTKRLESLESILSGGLTAEAAAYGGNKDIRSEIAAARLRAEQSEQEFYRQDLALGRFGQMVVLPKPPVNTSEQLEILARSIKPAFGTADIEKIVDQIGVS